MNNRMLPILAVSTVLAWSSTAQINKVDDMKKALETSNKDTVAWTHAGVLNVGLNGGFLHNWAAGGELASMSLNGIFNGRLDRLYHRDIWSNNLDLTYGLQYNYSTNFVPRKTDDRIDFTSKYGHLLDTSKNFYLTSLFNFRSQFTKAYNYAQERWDTGSTSRFFSPAYFTLAQGFEYRKGSDVTFFLSPIAARLTVVDKYYTSQSPEGAFGVPYNKTTLLQLGAYFSGRYVFHINKNITYRTRLDLYSDYLAKDTKDSSGAVIKKDNPGNIAVLFDNLIAWKLSKIMNITLGATFIYDNNIPYNPNKTNALGVSEPKNEPGAGYGWLQVKQVFTIGIGIKF